METEIWETLEDLVATGDEQAVTAELDSLPPFALAHALDHLSDESRQKLFELLPPDQAADLVAQISDVQAAAVMEDLEPGDAAAILFELPLHEQADLIGELEDEDAEAILAAMDQQTAAAVRELATYDEDVAGSIMTTEALVFDQRLSVGDVVRDLQTHSDRYRDYQVQYLHVRDRTGRLTGIVQLRDLLLNRGATPLLEILRRNPVVVGEFTPLDQVADLFEAHDFLALPVVNAEGVLEGLIRRDDLEAALGDRSDADYRKTQGIVGGEELRTLPYLTRSRRRLSWLSINVFLNIIAASVIAAYQETLAAVIALAAFLPIISDMSGCSGNQAVAVSMREMALGVARPSDVFRVLRNEVSLALLNGVVLGALVGVVGWVWQGNAYLGLVVGTALALNTLIAVAIGGSVPLLLKGWDLDPALASGPILTTITDLCGFFLTLSLATALLTKLV